MAAGELDSAILAHGRRDLMWQPPRARGRLARVDIADPRGAEEVTRPARFADAVEHVPTSL